jgi:hypothetical protein
MVYNNRCQKLNTQIDQAKSGLALLIDYNRYLASAPRQCAVPRGPECQGILGQAQHPRGSPSTLLTRFGPLRLLPLPQAVEHPEGETISRHRGDTTKYDMAVAGHSQTSLPDMH